MTTYKEVFQLAQEKGFKKVFSGISYTSLGEEYALAELTLIQKWLRDEHKIIVVVIPKQIGKYIPNIYCTVNSPEVATISYSTYEKADLEGTYEALKLL